MNYCKKKFQIVKIHPNYKWLNKHNDIALLKLKSIVKFTGEIKPICLSSSDNVPQNLTITGYGSISTEMTKLTGRLMKGIVQNYQQNECMTMYRENGRDLIDEQFCANSQSGIDACQVSFFTM